MNATTIFTDVSPYFFFIFAGMAILFSAMVVFKKNPASSAFSLVLVFFSFAGIYASMDAHLVAALQILVYAGAIMVLFVFVIMLLNSDVPSLDMRRSSMLSRIFSISAVAALLVGLIWVFKNSPSVVQKGMHTPEKIAQVGGNTRAISQLMFSDYLLPFELTSVLLLVGIVGSVALAKRKMSVKGGGSK